ncbi:MAG: hypothetical protein JOZ81_03705, partial [Chloroflexi bacterium]|nr:hypothetical protein [Chloroflexota bacterium]
MTTAPESLLIDEVARLQDQVGAMQVRIRRGEDRRKALLHILVDYEQDRRRLHQQAERLDNSRRALLHILQ